MAAYSQIQKVWPVACQMADKSLEPLTHWTAYMVCMAEDVIFGLHQIGGGNGAQVWL